MNILSPPFPSQVVVVGLGKISQPSVLMELAFLGSSLRLLVLLLLLLLLSRVSRVRLCATHRRQPIRLHVPGILQARTLEWVAISFSNA